MNKNYTIKDINEGLNAKKFSCREITKSYLERIRKNKLNSFITIDERGVLTQAESIDKKIKAGEKLEKLEGVLMAVKDNLMTKGIKTTAASKILENYIAVYDATVIEKLKKAGAIILGKTNCDEFAMGASTENSAFGPVLNPWDRSRVPGGSSGGSAASVSAPADECVFSLGSDTGGSIRQPAAFCGVVGLKPTYGLVSRYGLIALASSFDQIGPLTKNIEDSALILQAIAGLDPNDATTVSRKIPDYVKEMKKDAKELKIGVIKECFQKGLDKEIEISIKGIIDNLKKQGFKVKEVSLPSVEYALACYYILLPAEASANLARYDGLRYGRGIKKAKTLGEFYQANRGQGFGNEVRRRIIIGTFVLSAGYKDAYYGKALAVRELIRNDFQKAFTEVDLLISPTTPTPAFKLKEKIDDPLKMYLADIFTVSANIAGLPALSLPVGFNKQKLPIGMQIIGNYFQEGEILRLGRYLENLL